MQVNQNDRITQTDDATGGNNMAKVAIAVIIGLAAVGYYIFSSDKEEVAPQEISQVELPAPAPLQPLETQVTLPEPETVNETVPAEEEADPVSASVEEVVAQPEVKVEPLPTLGESDEYVQNKAVDIANGMAVAPLIIQQNLARQFVVFVDNLAQGELARKVSPMKGPNRTFTVSEITNKTYLNPDSYHRYDMYADLLANIDTGKLSATYQQLSPLFEQAFGELGYQELRFKERLIDAIDVMLEAPIIETPIELDGVSVNYQFVDTELEALPNAQKLLVRMGPDNTRKVKKALRRLQKQL